MRNDIVISKMTDHIEKIQQYTQGMTYEIFSDNEILPELKNQLNALKSDGNT